MRATAMPNGLTALGFDASHLDSLATGAEPQYRVIRNAPKDVGRDDLKSLFRAALTLLVAKGYAAQSYRAGGLSEGSPGKSARPATEASSGPSASGRRIRLAGRITANVLPLPSSLITSSSA